MQIHLKCQHKATLLRYPKWERVMSFFYRALLHAIQTGNENDHLSRLNPAVRFRSLVEADCEIVPFSPEFTIMSKKSHYLSI